MADQGIDAAGTLADPLRRRLYRFVVARGGGVSRADAADALGEQRNLVAFHLDKLVEAGLLDVTRRKVSGREGPGSGRPAKLYSRSDRELAVQIPPRDYETAARLLADAVEQAGADTVLYAAARREGERQAGSANTAGESLDDLVALLEQHGYEPADEDLAECGSIRLRNCPFHHLARAHPTLTCGMNLELVRGLLTGFEGFRARMAPSSDRCCVAISKNNED